LEQLFRLANVTVATTSAAGRIHGLDRAMAESVVAGRTKGFWLPLIF
jgi:membrane protein YdbS with pleckstrin-like domain